MSEETKQIKEYKLQISFEYKRQQFKSIPLRHPIQLKSFYGGLKIRNISESPSPAGTIKKLSLQPAEGATINHTLNEEIAFPKLNPKEEKVVWFSEVIQTVQKGQTWVECDIAPDDSSNRYITYQVTSPNNDPSPHNNNKNKWGDAFVIVGKLENQQKWTNFLILILTLLVFLEGVWGLDEIVLGLIDCIGYFFLSVGKLLIGN